MIRVCGSVAVMALMCLGGLTSPSAAQVGEWEWVLVDENAAPGPRGGMASCFDPVSGMFLVFGGADTSFSFQNDLWGWDGNEWTLLHAGGASAPSPRAVSRMVYEPKLDIVVLFGGSTVGGSANDTWIWNRNEWVELDIPVNDRPPARQEFGMTYYPPLNSIVVMAGYDTNEGNRHSDAWTFNGGVWEELLTEWPNIAFEIATGNSVLRYVDSTQGLYLLGHNATSGSGAPRAYQMSSNFIWSGASTPPQGSLSVWDMSQIAPSSIDGGIVVFGAQWLDLVNWIDGAAYHFSPLSGQWTRLGTESPPGRRFHSFEYDSVRDQYLMYGGQAPPTAWQALSDFWILRRVVNTCPADLTGDGILDFFDVQAFLTAFAASDPVADFNNDTVFDFFDVQAFLTAFAAGCP